MKLRFLVANRVPQSEIVIEVSSILSGRGFAVEHQVPEEALIRLDTPVWECDVYLLKSYTDLALSLAGALHARSARLLNSYTGCAAARNKIVASQVLRAAGVPAPYCWLTGDLGRVRPLLEQFPLIIKPYMGWRGEGVRVVRNERELAAVPPPAWPILIQEYLEGSGEDLRLYVAGEQVFATRKPFSATSFSHPGRPVEVTREMRDIAMRVGSIFGLGLYGLDLIEATEGLKVVDVNYFPGYKGVPHAAIAVADYIDRFAHDELRANMLQPEWENGGAIPALAPVVAGAEYLAMAGLQGMSR
jgi:ribosomal protein S6--L-glutamate ligase